MLLSVTANNTRRLLLPLPLVAPLELVRKQLPEPLVQATTRDATALSRLRPNAKVKIRTRN